MENFINPKSQICIACKIEKPIDEFYLDRRITSRNGFRKECKLCDIKKSNKYNREHKAERNAYRKFSPRGRYNSYKNDAKHSGIPFLLSFDEFMTLWKKSCTYCNSEVDTIGVDRINSKGNYEISNVVACCGKCNMMKRHMSVTEFLEQCQKIINFSFIRERD